MGSSSMIRTCMPNFLKPSKLKAQIAVFKVKAALKSNKLKFKSRVSRKAVHFSAIWGALIKMT